MKERGDRTGRGTAGARWWRYVPALILVAAATASRWAFGMVTGAPQAPYGPFFIAALLAFRLGGLGPAILAGALGAFSNIAFFHDGQEPFRLGLYFVSTGLAIALFEALHRARGHAEQSAALAAERERLLIESRDLLERRVEQRTAELGRSRHQLANAQALAHVGSWEWETGSRTIAGSEELHRIFDLPPESPWVAFLRRIHRADRPKVRAAFAAALTSRDNVELQCRVVAPGGQVRWIHTRAHVLAGEESPLRLFGTAQDITERHEAESRFEQLLESAPVAFVILDTHGRIMLVNTETERLFGYRRENLLDQSVEILVPEGMREVHTGHRRFYAADPRRRTMGSGFNIFGRRRDGTLIPVEITVSPLDIGGVTFITAAIRDVSDRHRAEEHIRALNADLERRVAERTAELERSNEELQQFAYITSHDLQEPLRTIGSFAELLERRHKEKLTGEAQEFLDYIIGAAGRMRRLIRGLLVYSRSAAQDQPLESVDCEETIGQAVQDLHAAIEESQARIEREPLPVIRARPLQLAQVFQNLIGNAIKYRSEEPPVIRISARRHGSEWIFSVADNGIGIDPAAAERIFLPFKRLHNDERYEGSGVGLAIVKKIVTRHGGRVWVEPNQPSGSVFHFTIPK